MKVGIAGFPRSGKTTIFNALAGQHADVGGFSEPGKVHLGTIKVPDARIDRLSEIFKPKKTTHAEIVFVDFPAASAASGGSALDAETVTQMRDTDALVHVVRGFDDPIEGTAADVVRDLTNFKSELILSDLVLIERRLERLAKEKGKESEKAVLERCKQQLDAEKPLRVLALAAEEATAISGFGFLSRRPLMVVVNVGENDVRTPLAANAAEWLKTEKLEGLVLSGKIEMEIAALAPEDRQAFLDDLGLKATARDRFIRAAYELLDQISFLTSGEDEVRAWTIKRGMTAVRAAGKIHSDIERGFIRAEVTHYEDFVKYGSDAKCREAGKLRLEGKEYVVQDGDIMHFRFNV
ncbi:MAG: redox-regulated ATPase YchF [Deltaproteobacteria bacterium]|nr:redox-regulated ATPase YchF [Deltaproteobacteria bacterium]